MNAWMAKSGEVLLRIVAYNPKELRLMGDARFKVVVQATSNGTPIVDDPLHVEYMDPLDLLNAIALSMREGWDISQEPACV